MEGQNKEIRFYYLCGSLLKFVKIVEIVRSGRWSYILVVFINEFYYSQVA